MELVCLVPLPISAVMISEIVRPDEPTEMEATTQANRMATKANNTNHFRRM
jgi:hypothetical protein